MITNKKDIKCGRHVKEGDCDESTSLLAPTTAVMSFESIFNQYKPQSPIILTRKSNKPKKKDGRQCLCPCEYEFYAPSLVQDPNNIVVGMPNEDSLVIGATGVDNFFSKEVNFSLSSWRLTINKGGAWQSPFHAHAELEWWIFTRGWWLFQWWDPCGPKIDLKGNLINFEDRGFPSGPNMQKCFHAGDSFAMPRGGFFQWGSSDPGAMVFGSWTGVAINGAIRKASSITAQFVRGEIDQEERIRQLIQFQFDFLTAFVF